MSVRTVKMFKSDVRSVPLEILMKFDVDDKNKCRLVCVKFLLNRCRFAVAIAKCLGGGSLFGTQCMSIASTLDLHTVGPKFTPPAYRESAAAFDRYLQPAPDLSSKPAARRCCCWSTGHTHTRTDRQTDTWPLYDANSIVRGPRNRERKCADTTGMAPVLCAGRFQC